MHLHLAASGAVEQHVADLLGIVLKGRAQFELVRLGKGFQNGSGKAALVRAGLPAHNYNGSLIDGQGLVRDHQILVKFHLVAQTETLRAGAEGIVEGKASGLHLVHADAAVRAGEALAEVHGLAVHHVHGHQTAGQGHHRLDGVRQALLDALPDHQAVHHHFNVVLDVLLQLDLFRQLIEIPVDAHPDVTALSGVVQHLHVFALAAAHHRSQKLDAGALRQGHNLIHHLVNGLLADLLAALGAVGDADSGVEKAHVVVNLRHRTHGGPGVAVGGLLINGNGGGKPLDALHIRLLHLSQELAGVGGQGLHIAPLPLRVNRVKGQRGLPGAGKSRQHHQFISRNIHGNILEVVLARSADLNVLLCHRQNAPYCIKLVTVLKPAKGGWRLQNRPLPP